MGAKLCCCRCKRNMRITQKVRLQLSSLGGEEETGEVHGAVFLSSLIAWSLQGVISTGEQR